MNFSLLSDTQSKPWCNIHCNSVTSENIDVNNIDSNTIKSDDLLLNQSAVIGVPDVGYSAVYADNANRLKVASQLGPTETIAYQSDIPASNQIISTDTLTYAKCSNGDKFNVSLSGVDSLLLNNVKSNLTCGNSSLNLASLSTGLDSDSTTYFASSNVGNSQNMAIVLLPSQAMIFQDSGNPRMSIDDTESTLRSKGYGTLGSRISLNNDSGFSIDQTGGTSSIYADPNTHIMSITSGSPAAQLKLQDGEISHYVFTNEGPNTGGLQVRDYISQVDQRFRLPNNDPILQLSEGGVNIEDCYTLPRTIPTVGQSIQADGIGGSLWVSPPPSFSSYARVSISGNIAQSLVSPSILGSVNIPANTFVLGSVWRLNCDGTYAVGALQTIVLSVSFNGVTLALTNTMSMANSPSAWSSSWYLTVQAVGAAGVAKLSSNSTSRMNSSVACSNTIDTSNFDTTVNNSIDMVGKMTINNADVFSCESVSFSRVI
ncbi:MAG: hypothetical protein Q8910_02780 [Bacteroidota bacterium]|nr:hypothetical protein [Bacteroidota bacterium]